jgi:hypothetical protein
MSNRNKKHPKFKQLKGNNVIREDGEVVRVEQFSQDGWLYHSTKGWRRKGKGWSEDGYRKIVALCSKAVAV